MQIVVVNNLVFVLKLLGNPAISIAGKLQTDSFYAVGYVRILSGRRGLAPVIKGAPGDVHHTAPPPDAADEVLPLANDLSFL